MIFPLLWKWQIPQPMRPRFAISPSEVRTPQRVLLSMVRSAPIGTGQDDQQLKIRARLFEQQAIFRVDFFSRGKCRKFLDTRGLGYL